MSNIDTQKTYKDFLEESRKKQIKELEELLKDPSKGSPTCRAIAHNTIQVLKKNRLLDLGHEL